MSVLFIALPIALVLGAVAVLAFVRSVRTGQFDDLVTPAARVVFDDTDAVPTEVRPSRSRLARAGTRQTGSTG
jgi:cbb3-type cytochrome oxidase maturation protein